MGKIAVDDPMNEVIRKAVQDSDDGTKYDMRVALVGGSSAAGGQNGPAKVIAVTLNSSTATNLTAALASAGLPSYNAINIQNFSALEIEMSYDSSWTYGTTGNSWAIVSGSEWHRDMTQNITVYAKSISGTPVVKVEGIFNT